MISRFIKLVGLGCAVAAAVLPHSARAANFFTGSVNGIDLGNAGDSYHWALFSIGSNITISDASYNPAFNDVIGNIGIAPYKNSQGNLTMSHSRVNGDVWINRMGNIGLSGGATITGHIFQDSSHDAILSQGATDAFNASTAANNLFATAGSPTTISLTNSSASYSALSLGANGTYVMHLTDFVLGNSTITLTGTADEHFVIDISRYFSLAGASQIVLTGGLTPQDVLFNVTGTNSVNSGLSGASQLSGIILAPKRNVTLTGDSTVLGEIIATTVALSGNSQVRNPLVSP